MFVFPAFDANYKTRKRTFKCCHACRVKRIKCEISSIDYEKVGCRNCHVHRLECDLITTREIRRGEGDNDRRDEHVTEATTSKPAADERLSPMKSGSNAMIRAISLKREDMHTITPQYLKDTFKFNISDSESSMNYDYLFHGHPNVVIANKSDDSSIWHESGVVVDIKNEPESKDKKSLDSARSNVSTYGGHHIQDERVYKFLVSIHAFTLDSPDYPLLDLEIEKLLQLYFLKINSIFPIVHEKRFWKDYQDNKVQSILVYALILAISRDDLAEPILKEAFRRGVCQTETISEEQFHERFECFMSDLEYKIRQVVLILPQLGDNEKFTRLLVSLLLHLHFGFHKLGNELSSHDLTDSLNIGFSLGIHMKHRASRLKIENSDYLANLWWVCFVFDRFNSLVGSRSVFVRQEDFNLDLPHNNINLLKMVQIARTLEHMFAVIYRPFNDAKIGSETLSRYKKFSIEEFKSYEFDLASKERKNPSDHVNHQYNNIEDLAHQCKMYADGCVYFYSRLLNNIIILVSQKANYDNPDIPNDAVDLTSLQAASNVLWYFKKTDVNCFNNLPLISWCLSIAMAVSLKQKAISIFKGKKVLNDIYDEYSWSEYMAELDKYSSKWKSIKEVCTLSKEFIEKLNSNVLRQKENDANFHGNGRTKKRFKAPASNDNTSLLNRNVEVNQLKAFEPGKGLLREQLPEMSSVFNSLAPESILNTNDVASSPKPLFTNMFNEAENQYEDYFESVNIDLFDNDFFEDLPHVLHHLNN